MTFFLASYSTDVLNSGDGGGNLGLFNDINKFDRWGRTNRWGGGLGLMGGDSFDRERL
jgi:hypothetical protein